MVDILRHSEVRDYPRLPFDGAQAYAPSRRSSISSHAGSEASVFSDTSIASSQSSVSTRTSSGWESSTQYDSDEEINSGSYDDFVPSSTKEEPNSVFSALKAARSEHLSKRQNALNGKLTSRKPSCAETDQVKSLLSRVSVRRDETAATTEQPSLDANQNKTAGCPFVRPLLPSQTAQNNRPRHGLSHPRRTTTEPGWSKPALVTQDERRLNFVENLVDTATELVALIWPTSVTPTLPDGQRCGTAPVISLRFFIRETLRRSRTSFSTLQVAMYYLALLNFSGNIPICDFTKEQRSDYLPGRALRCGRRMFLASLILASKYLQDRNYFTKAWSRISNLSVAEINKNEMALLSALGYKLHIKTTEFQRWTDCIGKCTTSVQRGFECPWSEGLKAMNLWRDTGASAPTSDASSFHDLHNKRILCPVKLDKSKFGIVGPAAPQQRSSTLPAHRLNLLRACQSVNPTRPVGLCARPPLPVHGDMRWPGMSAHLNTVAGNNAQLTASPEALAESRQPIETEDNNGLLLSPPKTPSPQSSDVEMPEAYLEPESGCETSQLAPPPAPREKPLSLNTTPDSNDGASTFGNYLCPMSSDAQGTLPSGGHPTQAPLSSVARFQADTLDHDDASTNENALPGLDSPSSSPSAGSFDLPSPSQEPVHFMHTQKKANFPHPALDRMETDFNASELEMMVMPDDNVAIVNSDIEGKTRRLTRQDITTISQSHATSLSSTPIAEKLAETAITTPAEDGTCRSEAKKCRAQKQSCCHRRKRGATSFSGGLTVRTKKAMRV